MSRQCPIYGRAIYLDCKDCIWRYCMLPYKTIVIGIDQSYRNIGISYSADGKLLKVRNLYLDKYKTNSEKRRVLRKNLKKIAEMTSKNGIEVICVIERIRLRSQGFLNIDYIKSIGALNSVIVDVMGKYNIPVYSVDTRCWKSQVVGTSKPMKNKFGVPDEKWPTVKWCIDKGFEFAILKEVQGRREKGTFIRNGIKYEYDNDASDSAAISQFYFVGDKSKLKLEK